MLDRIRLIVVVLVTCLLSLPADAIDRDAKMILGVGGRFGESDSTDFTSLGGGAEFALGNQENLGLMLDVGQTAFDNEGDQETQWIGIGLAYYLTPDTSLRLSLDYSVAELSFASYVDRRRSGYLYNHLWDSDIEGSGYDVNFSLKHRLIPASEPISPYVSAHLGLSTKDAKVSGTAILVNPDNPLFDRWEGPAGDHLSYDYDTTFSMGAAIGTDIYLSEDIGLFVSASYTRFERGGSVTVYGEEYEFDDDSQDSWSLGLGLKYYIEGKGSTGISQMVPAEPTDETLSPIAEAPSALEAVTDDPGSEPAEKPMAARHDLPEKLRELKKLHEDGLLTDDEFEVRRKALVDQL